MSTTAAPTVTTKKATDCDDDLDERVETSTALAVFVMITAITGAVLALVDYFHNGFWAAVGHATFVVGAFFLVLLCLCLALNLTPRTGPREKEGSAP